MIKFGSNRIVIIGKDFVYKLPITRIGVLANYQEYKLSLDNELVAHTEYKWYGLKQERLRNIKIYSRYESVNKIGPKHMKLYKIKLNNRLQVGQDKFGKWKIFDYEDVKYFLKDLRRN